MKPEDCLLSSMLVLFRQELHTTWLSVWSRRDVIVTKWEKLRVIEVLSIAFVEDPDMVFLGTNDGIFAIELISMSVKKGKTVNIRYLLKGDARQ
uniref:Uncharacterized protein n=1 Tax=Leersia perrieri TaxID=77586 RepID=A0A0D9V1Z8_9ORYZ